MLPTRAAGPFDDPAYLFEPWWPGTRAIVFVEDGRVRLQAAELADVLAAFPELAGLADRVAAPDAILDGVVLVLDRAGRPDPALLRRRLEDPAEHAGRPAFVAHDLLAASGRRLTRLPFRDRRERLAAQMRTTDWCTVSRGYPGEGRTLALAAADLGFRWLSAHRLDAAYRAGAAGDAWLRVPTAELASNGPPSDERRDVRAAKAAFAEPRLPPILAVFRRLPLGD
jgi:bifunctional non-homologous end joining protein LigD